MVDRIRKNIASSASDKELSQMSKNFKTSTTTINPLKKWATNLNWHFSEEEIEMAKKHMRSQLY